MLATAVFYALAFVLILAAVLVVSARNPVHSVLFLILSFFTSAALFVLLGAEFIAFTLAIVYVGAVAVLFLFVVMMLNIDLKDLKRESMQYVPLGLLIGGVMLVQLFLVATLWTQLQTVPAVALATPTPDDVTNTHALGQVLYTQYIVPFQISGLILLVAMIGAIGLTLRSRPGTKRQVIAKQVATRASDVVIIQQVETGKGVNIPS